MSLYEWVLAALLAVPISKHDRLVEPEVKRAQVVNIARAISSAAQDQRNWPGEQVSLAGMLIVTARFESGLAMHVHAGNCRPHECDRGRARGLWQQQASSTSSRAAWLHLGGLDAESTLFAAREAARALTRARWQCRSLEARGGDWAAMTFSAYAGRGCVGWFRGREQRVEGLRRLVAL